MKERQQFIPYIMPFCFFFLMLIDGHISNAILSMMSVPMAFTCNLLLMVMMFATFQLNKTYMVFWAAVMGLLYDSYYYNVIGINLLLFPLLVLLMYFVFERVIPSTLTIILSFIVFVTCLSLGRILLLTLFDLTDTTILDVFTRTLAPTLILNLILILIFVIPLKKAFNVKK
ncbi:rod shape-determining protein MreD [Vagococcus sp.]|uniref:rod shape-determining protein MreD n=1 Tax=Vagococcus sp. TaxID=1933889 RepID=UPI003F995337